MACAGAKRGRIAAASRRLLVAFALLVALPAVAQADWPVYGHDLINTRSAGTDGPSTTQVRGLHQVWAFHAPANDFTGTPVVAGGVLVAGDNGGTAYALNAATGQLLWSRHLGHQINGSAAVDLRAPGGAIALVPVADIGAPRLVAVNLSNGSPRWDVVLTRQPGADVFGSPTFWQGAVYIGTSGPNTDTATSRGSVVALDEATGVARWQTFTVPPGHDGGGVWSTPAIDTTTGRLYVGTGNAYHAPAADTTDSMLALDASSGQILGHFQATSNDSFDLGNNPFGPDVDFGASPNLFTDAHGRQLVGEGDKNGVYYTLDRATMKPVWQQAVGPGSFVGGILASTAFDGTRIFGNDTLSANVWALRTDGSTAWASNDLALLDYPPVSVSNGVLYSVNPLGLLITHDAVTGGILSISFLGGPSFGGSSEVGKTVYVSIGLGPLPSPLPPIDFPGAIVAFR
jgi:polyvinyl alcohol dehydrogenase (cytochrome)